MPTKTLCWLGIAAGMLVSCQFYAVARFDPQEETWEAQQAFLDRIGINHPYQLAQFTPEGVRASALLIPRPERSGENPDSAPAFKPWQFRVFDQQGRLIAHYAKFCNGPVSAYLDTFPPRGYWADTTHTLAAELDGVTAFSGHDLSVMSPASYRFSSPVTAFPGHDLSPDQLQTQYDYLLVVYWSISSGKLSKQMLKRLDRYLAAYPEARVGVVYVNLGEMRLPE